MPGVTFIDRRRCGKGYTLFSSRETEEAHLIDREGDIVHSWSYAQGRSWHYAEMLPNGNLVAIDKDRMILELDWNSRLIWKAETVAHHDFDRLANGNTLALSQRRDRDPWREEGEMLLDTIVEYGPRGKVVWEWRPEEHIEEMARFVDLILPPPPRFKDWPHVNTIESLPNGPTARKDRRFKAGNLLFCGRHIDTIGVIERSTGEVVWAWGTSELLGPHLPTMLPNGNILIYDNGHNRAEATRGYSRIVELDPVSERIVWEYVANPPGAFDSHSRGSSQRLPNGNTLIAESNSGRLFEITLEGEVVWEYLAHALKRNGQRQELYRALRYPKKLVEQLIARKRR